MGDSQVSISITEELLSSATRLDALLAKATGKSRTYIREQIDLGNVQLNGHAIKKPSEKLRLGDVLTATWAEEESPEVLEPIPGNLEILFEDKFLLVINKAQGVVVHPAAGHRGDTLIHYLLHHLNEDPAFVATSDTRPGLVHRLDRGTSGVILIAKNREVQDALSKQFKDRTVEKTYEAVSWGVTKDAGTFRSEIGRDKKDRKKMSSKTHKGRDAITKWQKLFSTNHFSHLELYPKTGRTHQLRVHLSENGFPIVGDDLYGVASAKRKIGALPLELRSTLENVSQTLLHAKALAFTHPVTDERLKIEAPRPEPFDTFVSWMKVSDL